jgi:hypothetical protein
MNIYEKDIYSNLILTIEHFTFSSHFYSYFVKHTGYILNIEQNMPVDYKYILFNIKNGSGYHKIFRGFRHLPRHPNRVV